MDRLFENLNENVLIDEDDQCDTLKETEVSRVFNNTLENCRLSYIEVFSNSLNVNFEQLYIEVLKEIYTIQDSAYQNFLIEFVQDVFKIDNKFHDEILKSTFIKEVPNVILNIEIIKGEILESEINKLSLNNPFCTLYLSSRSQNKFNTSFRNQTLQPVWEEHFSIPLENSLDGILFLELWDFISDEIIMKNTTKSVKLRYLETMKRALKNIMLTTAFIRQKKTPIACTQIPLKTISSISFTEAWYTLKNQSGKQQGRLLIKLSLGKEKKKQAAIQEHRHLLRLLLNYQINKHNIQTNSWMGNFLIESEIIIKKHVACCNINSKEEYLDRWTEFIDIHLQNPVIHFKVFLNILNNLVKSLTEGELSDYELKVFWQSAKKVLPFCYNVIRTIRCTPPEDEKLLNEIECVLGILQIIQSLDVPNYLELFTSDIYDWLSPCDHTRDVRSTLQDAVIQAAQDWIVHISENNRPKEETEKYELQFQFKIIQLLELDLQKAVNFHNKLFIEKMQFPYAGTIFSVYEKQIAEKCETFIKCVFMNIKSIKFDKNEQFKIDDDLLTLGRLLFTIYIGIQRFLKYGMHNIDKDFKESCLIEYHTWFQDVVSKWLDIGVYRAIQRIDIAIEMDTLVKIEQAEFSTSAEDILTVLYDIIVFWKQLAWPDVEKSYFFLAKIIDDITKCSLHYSDKMGDKISHITNRNRKIEGTKEWCLAVNNIEHIKRSVRNFVNDRSIEELIKNLADNKSEIEAKRCKRTLDSIIDSTIECLNDKIEDILRNVTNKMTPCIRAFLNEGGEVTQKNNKYLDNLMQYLDANLSILYNELNEKNFEHIFEIIIETIGNLIFNVVNTNMKKKKRCSYFGNLRDNFHILFGFLYNGNDTEYRNKKIQELERLLNLNAMDSIDLINKYYLQKILEQKKMQVPTEGVLTVKLAFVENDLSVEILNAHQLKPMNSSGFCDPFVMVVLLPQHRFQNVVSLRTAVQKKTLNPLFDASFKIPLTFEQRNDENGIVMFIIEDEDYMGFKNEFMCETFMHFKDIPSIPWETDLNNLPQIKLNMTVPKSLDSNILQVLNSRTKEKLASNFIKQIKVKIPAIHRG